MNEPHATFVLVPGAWHGAWCFRDVVRVLRARGHAVFPVTLTGVGERLHLASASTNLTTHVEDVAAVIVTEELEDVVLVGHSYAGMVVSGVAERYPEYLRSVVHLDALVPDDGEMMFDLTSDEFRGMATEGALRSSSGFMVPPPPIGFLGVDEQHAAWVARRLTAHPLGTATERLSLGTPSTTISRHYFACDSPSISTTHLSKERVRRDHSWTVHTLEAGHEAAITHADEVSELLLRIANTSSQAVLKGSRS